MSEIKTGAYVKIATGWYDCIFLGSPRYITGAPVASQFVYSNDGGAAGICRIMARHEDTDCYDLKPLFGDDSQILTNVSPDNFVKIYSDEGKLPKLRP